MYNMKKAIALDIGGTNLRCALINEKYEIEKVLIKNTLTGSLEAFLEEVAKIIEEIGLSKDVVGIAMGVPGKVRWDGFIPELPNIGIKNIPLAEFINEKFHLTTTILNDAAVAALGEAVLGNGEGHETVFFITISTGVGGALVRNKRIIVADDESQNVFDQLSISFYRFFVAGFFAVLLNCPNCPQWHVGQVDALHVAVERTVFHEFFKGSRGSFHDCFEVGAVVYRQRCSRQRDEFVASADFKPWISCQYVASA